MELIYLFEAFLEFLTVMAIVVVLTGIAAWYSMKIEAKKEEKRNSLYNKEGKIEP